MFAFSQYPVYTFFVGLSSHTLTKIMIYLIKSLILVDSLMITSLNPNLKYLLREATMLGVRDVTLIESNYP